MNKLQKSAPQGQYRLAQGSALGRSVATRQRPVRAASFKLLRATVLPLQGVVSLVPYNPGRCPGLGDDWPYRPLNTTSETSISLFNVNDHSFVGQIALWEHLSCFFEECCFVFVACAVMAQEEPAHPCIACHRGGVVGRAVPVLSGALAVGLVVGAFMIKHADASDQLVKRGNVAGVGAVGIAAWRVGGNGQAAVGHDFSLFGHPIGSVLNVVDLAEGDVVGVNHVPADVRQRGLLAEEEATTGNAMLEGNGLDGKGAVFVDDLMERRVDGMELDRKLQPIAEQAELFAEHGAEGLGCIDVKGSGAPQQAKG